MRIKKIDHLNLLQKLIIFFMFLANMNFLQNSYYCIYIAFALTVLLCGHRLKIDFCCIVLCLFSLCYIIFSSDVLESITLVLKSFAYPMCYIVGLNLITNKKVNIDQMQDKEPAVTTAFIAVGMGSFVNYALNLLINWESSYRNNIDIWSGEIMSATSQALMAVIPLSIFCAILFSAKTWKLRLVAVAGLLVIIFYNFILAGRTLLVLLAILIAFSFFCNYRKNDKIVNKKNIIMVISIIAFLMGAYYNNFLGIRSSIENSNLFLRFMKNNFTSDSRFTAKFEYLKLSIKYPFGGQNIKNILNTYAHDLYLDTYDEAGIFTLVFLIIFVIYAIVTTIRVLKQPRHSVAFQTLVSCVFLSLHIIFFVEPILQAMSWIFAVFCFYQGIITSEYYSMEEYR